MSRYHASILLCGLLVAFPALAAGDTTAPEPFEWPREYESDRGKLVMYQPQITEWEGFRLMKARIALAYSAVGADAPILGAVEAEIDTEVDRDTQLVRLFNLRITGGRFPLLPEGDSEQIKEKVATLLPAEAVTTLARVLANLERGDRSKAREAAVKVDPPKIIVSTLPAILVLLDGKALMSPIPDNKIKFAVNTNWDLFQLDSVWYLLNEDAWIKALRFSGPWTPAGKLPKPFKKLPKKDPNWEKVKKQIPGRKLTNEEVPQVHVSEVPAELILIDGEPKLSLIEGTRLLWVNNTESDLFLSNSDSRFYYLVSGRWFSAENLDGPWTYATPDLPADFAKIPTDHPRQHVRSSVPGTAEADEAVLLAQVPQKATVERGSLQPDVAYSGEPEFKPIEGTSMYYAANTPNDVIRVGDLYYLCFQAVWFASTKPNGPWEVADDIPDEIYTIPPSSPVYHTTYVEVYDHTSTTVVVGYTSGYTGVYYSSGCVVYGTGWYYAPYYYWGPYYPIYYPYHVTYGAAAYYNPHTGTYGRGVYGYGPYGGWGYGARYNPSTGTYARGGAAWGPYQYGRWAEAYNPRTGTYANTYQGGDAYSHWGTSGISRGDDWIRTGHYAGEDGGIAGYRTSEGGSGFVARNEDNLYAGRDGNVYRKGEEGWQQYNDGGWDSVERPSPERAGPPIGAQNAARPERDVPPIDAPATAKPERGALPIDAPTAPAHDNGARRRSLPTAARSISWIATRAIATAAPRDRTVRATGAARVAPAPAAAAMAGVAAMVAAVASAVGGAGAGGGAEGSGDLAES